MNSVLIGMIVQILFTAVNFGLWKSNFAAGMFVLTAGATAVFAVWAIVDAIKSSKGA